jgi:hypothetical protein
MLDIHEINNRNTGAPREEPRAPIPKGQLSEAAKRLQARIERMRRDKLQQGSENAA